MTMTAFASSISAGIASQSTFPGSRLVFHHTDKHTPADSGASAEVSSRSWYEMQMKSSAMPLTGPLSTRNSIAEQLGSAVGRSHESYELDVEALFGGELPVCRVRRRSTPTSGRARGTRLRRQVKRGRWSPSV